MDVPTRLEDLESAGDSIIIQLFLSFAYKVKDSSVSPAGCRFRDAQQVATIWILYELARINPLL